MMYKSFSLGGEKRTKTINVGRSGSVCVAGRGLGEVSTQEKTADTVATITVDEPTEYVDRANVPKLIATEKRIMRLLIQYMGDEKTDECTKQKLIDELKKNLESYYWLVAYEKYGIPQYDRNNSLFRFLCFLVKYPVRFNVNPHVVADLYIELWLLDMCTFVMKQYTTWNDIQDRTVDNFLKYVQGTSIENLAVMYLYRTNPKQIMRFCYRDDFEALTPKELYYGVYTGYFQMRNGAGITAIRRLEELGANEEIEKLRKNGFRANDWIKSKEDLCE